jgi:hypothetical protein
LTWVQLSIRGELEGRSAMGRSLKLAEEGRNRDRASGHRATWRSAEKTREADGNRAVQAPSWVAGVLALQRSAGNRALAAAIAGPGLAAQRMTREQEDEEGEHTDSDTASEELSQAEEESDTHSEAGSEMSSEAEEEDSGHEQWPAAGHATVAAAAPPAGGVGFGKRMLLGAKAGWQIGYGGAEVAETVQGPNGPTRRKLGFGRLMWRSIPRSRAQAKRGPAAGALLASASVGYAARAAAWAPRKIAGLFHGPDHHGAEDVTAEDLARHGRKWKRGELPGLGSRPTPTPLLGLARQPSPTHTSDDSDSDFDASDRSDERTWSSSEGDDWEEGEVEDDSSEWEAGEEEEERRHGAMINF